MVIELCEYSKNQPTVLLRRVNCILVNNLNEDKFVNYLNKAVIFKTQMLVKKVLLMYLGHFRNI